MPTLNTILLIQIFYYTKSSVRKHVISVGCSIFWLSLIIVQLCCNIHEHLEWISIALWSYESLPQVILNMKRRSTHGLSNLSMTITAVGKITDFAENYLLLMPVQYVVMIFFSSTVAQIGTIQVLYYWKQRPLTTVDGEEDREKLLRDPISPTCNILRILGILFFSSMLLVYMVAVLIRLPSLFLGLALIGTTYFILLACHLYIKHERYHQNKDATAAASEQQTLPIESQQA